MVVHYFIRQFKICGHIWPKKNEEKVMDSDHMLFQVEHVGPSLVSFIFSAVNAFALWVVGDMKPLIKNLTVCIDNFENESQKNRKKIAKDLKINKS